LDYLEPGESGLSETLASCTNLQGIIFYKTGIFINTSVETPNFPSLFIFSI